MIVTIIASIISFISTNIDDVFVLMLLYSQVDGKQKKHYIIMGQYLGIAVLVFLSLLGAFGLQFIPQKYIGFMGIIPIILGVKVWIDYKKESVESYIESKNNSKLIIKSGMLSVMFITIANGADNIGIYIPLFTGYSFGQIFVTIIIFVLLTALWCFLGYKLANIPMIKTWIQKYKHIVVPLVFIGLGFYIMIKSRI